MRRRTQTARDRIAGLRHSSSLRLTSMMDILTVLLLFLLKSFVVEGQVVSPPAGLELPESSAEVKPEESLVIAIFDGAIMVGEDRVVTIEQSMASDDLFIQPLGDRLQEMAAQTDEIARLREDETQEVRKATIQGDREIEFQILERVMYTLSESGYEDISLAVLQTS